jgi:hypothetical protein
MTQLKTVIMFSVFLKTEDPFDYFIHRRCLSSAQWGAAALTHPLKRFSSLWMP